LSTPPFFQSMALSVSMQPVDAPKSMEPSQDRVDMPEMGVTDDKIDMPEELFMSLLKAGAQARQSGEHQLRADRQGKQSLCHSSVQAKSLSSLRADRARASMMTSHGECSRSDAGCNGKEDEKDVLVMSASTTASFSSRGSYISFPSMRSQPLPVADNDQKCFLRRIHGRISDCFSSDLRRRKSKSRDRSVNLTGAVTPFVW